MSRKVDWFRIITDLNRKGYSQRKIAEQIGCCKSALNGWYAGHTEPNYSHGVALVEFHATIIVRDSGQVQQA